MGDPQQRDWQRHDFYMHDDQIKIVYEMIDPEYWKRTFKKREEDHEFVKQTLAEAGIE